MKEKERDVKELEKQLKELEETIEADERLGKELQKAEEVFNHQEKQSLDDISEMWHECQNDFELRSALEEEHDLILGVEKNRNKFIEEQKKERGDNIRKREELLDEIRHIEDKLSEDK